MIRLVIFLVVTAGLAFAAAWLAVRPGEVAINWLGYHADTSFAVLVGVVLAIACAAVIAWSLIVYLVTAPAKLAQRSAQRRVARGYHAITRGLIAIGAGDARAAAKHANEAARHAADQPLTLLLQAQTAQLSGARSGADAAFRAMADRAETKLLGLRGLYVEAQRRNDVAAARGFAEEAAKAAPSLTWAGQATFDFHCAEGNWLGALEALERNNKGGLVDKDAYRRQRAVLLAARALSLENTDRAAASELAQEAVKLCPGLIPAAALAGRLLAAAGDRRKAGRILEAAWREAPHPDIADAYGDLVPGASARERLSRIRILSHLAENHVEGRLAVARAALDAHEFAEARASLKPLIAAPTRRVAALMAQLEEAETGDVGRARQWMARAVHAGLDPVWTADGLIAENWMPVSPATGRLDAFQWRVPVADLTPRGPLIEPAPSAPAIAAPVAPEVIPAAKDIRPEPRPKPEPTPAIVPEPKPAPESRPETKIEVQPSPSLDLSAAPPPAAQVPRPADVAAFAVPDDPGLAPEPAEPTPRPKPGAERGLFSWFSRNASRPSRAGTP
jgi:HemY protein